MKAARDVIEHNAGVVNETYLRKASKSAQYQIGDYVEINDDYHLACWRLVKKVVTEVTEAVWETPAGCVELTNGGTIDQFLACCLS